MARDTLPVPAGYDELLRSLKVRVRAAQLRAALSVNRELVLLYRNLKCTRALAEAWPEEGIVQEVLARITWYHKLTIVEKLKVTEERIWYAHQTIEHGWSRNVLVHQIESGLFHRQGMAITNFEKTLPAPQSELAQQLIKDPYLATDEAAVFEGGGQR
jgi:predicted nuclease of restriction endonuclease-like (RecB) superfamily